MFVRVTSCLFHLHLKFTESESVMNMVMRGFEHVTSAPANTPHAKTHAPTPHLLASWQQGVNVLRTQCVICGWGKRLPADTGGTEQRYNLLPPISDPPPRKAAQTTNTSSREEPRSKDLEAEESLNRVKEQGRAVGKIKPIGDGINRWRNMLEKGGWSVREKSGGTLWLSLQWGVLD